MADCGRVHAECDLCCAGHGLHPDLFHRGLDLEFADMKTIMDMALEAGFTEREIIRAVDNITRFAALVRADERERLLQAVEEMRPVQSNPLLQNKPPEFWISNFKKVIEARGNT